MEWLQEHPCSAAQREHELLEERAKIEDAVRKIENDIASLEGKKGEMPKEDYENERRSLENSLNGAKGEYNLVAHQWFAKYRWTRNRMAAAEEGADSRPTPRSDTAFLGMMAEGHAEG